MNINQNKEFNGVAIVMDKKEARVSHFELSKILNVKPRSTMKLILQYQDVLETHGLMRFKIAARLKGKHGGGDEQIAMLNENQSFFILTLSRNTVQAVQAKSNLVHAFKNARDALTQHETQYLPMHHACHDGVHQIAMQARAQGSTTPEAMFHMNVEKLINKVFGFPSHMRHTLTPQQQTQVSMAYTIYEQSTQHVLNQGLPANDAYALAKPRIEQLAGMMNIQQLGAA